MAPGKISDTIRDNEPQKGSRDGVDVSGQRQRIFEATVLPCCGVEFLKWEEHLRQGEHYERQKEKLKPVIKSLPVPKNNKRPARVVAGKTFDDAIVMDPQKDVLIEFCEPWCGHYKQLEPIYTNLGKKYKDQKDLVIVKMDAPASDNTNDRYKKEKLKPVIKSLPVPKNNKRPARVVAGKTFDDAIVMDPQKDVLIEFCEPWCGHYKQLEPIYTNLGKKYKDQKDLVIVKMDAPASDNTNDRYKVEGFSTIYFASSGDKLS
ncbi:Protein disulfide-isomerase A4 [Microtus ochrogaster]|uniref:Protein disulfide-isomerase A4 n=1 Tax=Microtus ochrogaster TaxID=79684 RepID=A0A8J6KWE1_MICOH|nr:Protein disulfide-isomerase A4 [Microtus ochrogaster]